MTMFEQCFCIGYRAIFCSVYYCLWNNVFIHNFNGKCLWCYTIFMVTPLTATPQKTGKYFQDKRKIISSRLCFICIVTVCVFVCHLFSFYPFYFDFHSARIIFDVSSGFYLWNINKITA